MQADQDKILRLLKTAKGQIEGIIKMVEENRYCIEISNQLSAADSILKKANKEVIHAHMAHCVRETFESGDEKAKAEKMAEILQIMDKMAK